MSNDFRTMQSAVYGHTHNWFIKSETLNQRKTIRKQVWACALDSCPETRVEHYGLGTVEA